MTWQYIEDTTPAKPMGVPGVLTLVSVAAGSVTSAGILLKLISNLTSICRQ